MNKNCFREKRIRKGVLLNSTKAGSGYFTEELNNYTMESPIQPRQYRSSPLETICAHASHLRHLSSQHPAQCYLLRSRFPRSLSKTFRLYAISHVN